MSTLATNNITDAAGGNTATINGMTPTADSLQGFRNRILNGGMVLDQRNNGASVTPSTTNTYVLDRWICGLTQASKFSVQQNAGSVTPPTGFTNYSGITSTSAYSVVSGDVFYYEQRIEGFNVSDLAFGTAAAASVTLSFWVRSSLTGTFGGALRNQANNRAYPFTFTVNAANTWEQKSITVAGDTSGTWTMGNLAGLRLTFGLGAGSTFSGTAGAWATGEFYTATGAVSVVGTNGATFYITGVQLEAGSVASPFERRPYGTELALCMRYYQLIQNMAGTSGSSGGTLIYCSVPLPVEMRATPSAGQTGVFNFDQPFVGNWTQSSGSVTIISAASSARGLFLNLGNFSGVTANVPLNKAGNTNALTLTAEL